VTHQNKLTYYTAYLIHKTTATECPTAIYSLYTRAAGC
jgi:hypothetical protein